MRLQTSGILRKVGCAYFGKVICVTILIFMCELYFVTGAAVINDTVSTTELNTSTEDIGTSRKQTTSEFSSSHNSYTDKLTTQKTISDTLYTKTAAEGKGDISTESTNVYAPSSSDNLTDTSSTGLSLETITNPTANETTVGQLDGAMFNNSENKTGSTDGRQTTFQSEVTTKSHKKAMDEKIAHDLNLVQHYTEFIKTNWLAGKHRNHPVDHHLNLSE